MHLIIFTLILCGTTILFGCVVWLISADRGRQPQQPQAKLDDPWQLVSQWNLVSPSPTITTPPAVFYRILKIAVSDLKPASIDSSSEELFDTELWSQVRARRDPGRAQG
ncbi:MAG TPA: hypothetical protein VHJ20_22720 [Polyangia bacterium]|nr:hypothetical protein [Polyangia bacterium]